jgi:anthranilate phosphoribosyltransferase
MKEFIRKISAQEHLTREEARAAMRTIMNGEATDAQIGSFLIGLKIKGEQTEEILGFVEVMREKSLKIHVDDPNAIDMCGTGGDGSGTFNISTAASLVAAGAGVTVAKHGNRSVSSSSGSADVLKALGVSIEIPANRVELCVNTIGIGFLFAPMFHPAMKHAAKPRAELGVKTCFNILGPMTNPANVRRQLVGAYNAQTAQTMASVFVLLGVDRVCVVHSDEGMDEVTVGSTTTIHELNSTATPRTYTATHADSGLQNSSRMELQGGDAAANAEIIRAILSGKRGPHRDVVLLNAAYGIYVSGRASNIDEALNLATASIDVGAALKTLNRLVEFTNDSMNG